MRIKEIYKWSAIVALDYTEVRLLLHGLSYINKKKPILKEFGMWNPRTDDYRTEISLSHELRPVEEALDERQS